MLKILPVIKLPSRPAIASSTKIPSTYLACYLEDETTYAKFKHNEENIVAFPAESKRFNFRELAHLRMTDAIMPKFRGRYRRIDKESV